MIGFEFLRQCQFLQARGEEGLGWSEPEAPEGIGERIREMETAYDTLGALDERLSFHEPGYAHVAAPEHFENYAAVGNAWKYGDIRELAARLERDVEGAFAELST